MQKNGLMGGIFFLCMWIMRFSITNILWFLFNLPIVFILISILYLEQIGNLTILLISLIVLMPVLFFPTTTAMYSCAREWLIKDEGNSLIKSYLNYFKENYKKSFLGGILLTALWAIWGIDLYYFSKEQSILMYSFIPLGILLYVYTINFFSIVVHYEMKLFSLLKKTLIVTIGSPILFFTVLISNGIIYLSVTNLLFLIPFFAGSFIAFLSFSGFYRLFLNLTKKVNRNKH